MNEIVNIFFLTGDKFMPETHLRQPGFTYSASGQFPKTKKEHRNLKIRRFTIYLSKQTR